MNGKTNKILKASFILLCVSWYSRLLSAVSIIVLARNLTRDDFGILAGCFIVQGFFNVLSNVGSGQYLIRKSSISEHDINAAWTINFLSRVMVALLIYLLSEPAAQYMQIPEMGLVLKVMSLSAVFIGLQNPAINLKIKQLDYSKLSVLEIVTKSISSTASVVIAMMFHTYWAVVIAGLLYNGLYALGSQFIVRQKLKFVIDNINVQWQFSKWILLKGVINYIKVAFDKVIVGKFYSVSELGLYNFANEASVTALQFVITPINKVLYPSLSDYVDDNQRLLDKVYKSIVVLSCIYIPVVFGGVYLANIIVPSVFGEQWRDATPLFQAFLVMTFSRMIVGVLTDVFTLTGEVKKQFFYEALTSVLFLLIILAVSSANLYDFAVYRTLVAYLMLAALFVALNRIISISMLKTARLVVPFIVGSLVMLVVVYGMQLVFITAVPLLNLLVYILVGALAYGGTTMLFVFYLKRISQEYDFLYKTFIRPFVNILKRRLLPQSSH
ncbi:oligosaccharide flippase family protein [Vibrio sp. CAIM 722]|uniref:Oligosaccharide flippase family protein n=1 Tax=Vibrio eleionomae TaxID=2653505 RepID=A0A7X4LQ51_9VIBR|nr:oligosaccharide flippase family protein [Vibrio eleionomae]MZI95551.1 oligosaccharide flippase family protein [Vibrio eleionomae]